MSDKPGRNEPCWCGSGLKYKKCHMQADREEERGRLETMLASRHVREELLEFAQDERFAIPFARALSLYWNDYYTIENADEMSEQEALRFFDWFVFDYQPEEGQRVADVYAEEMADDLAQAQREVLESWLEAPPAGAYLFKDYEGQELYLEDFLTGEELDVYDPAGRGASEIGDIILARVVPVGERLQFGPGAAYLPPEEIGDLKEKMENARVADAETHPDATFSDFLRRHNHLLIHHALEQAEAAGRPPVSRLQEA